MSLDPTIRKRYNMGTQQSAARDARTSGQLIEKAATSPMATHDTPTGTDLYRFYDLDGQLLYVGISIHAAVRASQHRESKAWWPDVDRMLVEHLTVGRDVAQELERQIIIDEKPIHNIAHNTRTQSVVTIAPRIVWICEICLLPIDDGTGYIEMPNAERLRYKAEKTEWEQRHPTGARGDWDLIDLDTVLDMPEDCHWWSVHRECDPEPDGGGYWFDIERARTHRDLLSWTIHLMEKKWMDETDWTLLVRKHLDLPGHKAAG